MKRLRVLFVASEVAPFVKTGGLADVAGSLPTAIKKGGHDIRVVMPQYGQLEEDYLQQLEHVLNFRIQLAWRNEYVGINTLEHNGVQIYFVDNQNFFHRPTLYESEDRHVQFAYFCRGVLEMLPRLDFQPHIIHCNDWHTGPLPLFLSDTYCHRDFYQSMKTVFTIHNLLYQGQFGSELVDDLLGVHHRFWEEGYIRHDNLVNYMKMGILLSHRVTTVSKGYAQEIREPFFGAGLDYALRMKGEALRGIINGISYQEFDPRTDKRIYANYDEENLQGKKENKRKLQQAMGLPQEDVPLVGMVTRLVDEKGLDLIAYSMEEMMQDEIQFVLLGSGLPHYEEMLKRIEAHYRQKATIQIGYDEDLAHRIYAGSDLFLMPSRFEPCGLSQLISFRYGTIPVVRQVGGLKDTVFPFDAQTQSGNGFTFESYRPAELLKAIRQAQEIYQKRDIWQQLVQKVMQLDYSWERSKDEYLHLYQELLEE